LGFRIRAFFDSIPASIRGGKIEVAEPRDYRQADIFRPALEAIIDMGDPLVRLAEKIDWGFPRPALRRGLQGARRTAAVAGPAPRRSLHPQAHAFAQRRGCVRALGGEPLMSGLYQAPVVNDFLLSVAGSFWL
jgi:hypothetical protein